MEFVANFLLPPITAGKKITLVSYSAGSAFAEMSRVALIQRLRQQRLTENVIREQLENIVLIGTASVSSSMDRPAGRDKLDFTSIFFNSRNDKTANVRFPEFQRLVPTNVAAGKLAVVRLTGNRLLVVMDTPNRGFVWMGGSRGPRFTGENVYGRDLVFHSLEFFTVRNPGTTRGAVLALERALRNSVGRTGYVDAVSLIRRPAKAISTGRPPYSLSPHVSYEVMAIEEALSGIVAPAASSAKRANGRAL